MADPATPHFIGFGGSSWQLARESVSGDRQRAASALREACLKVLPGAVLPPGEPGPAEAAMLESVARTKPVAQEPGRWRLYELDGPFPMAAGTLLPGEQAPSGGRNQLAAAGARVVAWAIGVPVSNGEWTLYVFHCPAPSSGPFPGLPNVPLPPESTRTLSMRVAGGGCVVAFAGASQAERWKRFFDRWFQAHEWTADGDWGPGADGWHHRYAGPGGESAGSVDVRFGPEGQGGSAGLLIVNPPDPTVGGK